MSESIERARIAAMCGAINGVQTAFPQIPRALQQAQLPAFVVFPGEATYDYVTLGEEMVLPSRVYNMILYLSEAEFETSGQLEINADPFFEAVETYFFARPGLELDSEGVNQSESQYRARLLGDGGLQVGPYPIGSGGKDYIQIRWRLQVQGSIIAVNYRD